MRYAVRQTTTYIYTPPASAAVHAIRCAPVDRSGQRVVDVRLSVTPFPVDLREASDFFGNAVSFARIGSAHPELLIESRFTAEIDREAIPLASLSPPWETVMADADRRRFDADAPIHYLYASRIARLTPAIRAYVVESFSPGRPVLEAALELMGRIKSDFEYDPKATDVATPPERAFQIKRGVCQDFAHIMISGLRGVGVPAAYVSGYLRTIPPPGKPRLEGADATHAWVDVWCGAQIGWIGLDPTNNLIVGNDHVVLAVGRDYADVSPVQGVIHASGGHDLTVEVDVKPI